MQFDYRFSDLCYIHSHCGEETVCEEVYRPQFKLLFLIAGRAELSIGERVFNLQAGDIALVLPGHRFRFSPLSETPVDYYLVYFTEHLIPTHLIPIYRYAEGAYPIGTDLIAGLFSRFDWHVEHSLDDEQVKMLFRCVLTEILVYLSRLAVQSNVPARLSRSMEAVILYIEQNLETALTIGDICEHFHYSRSYLCSEFTQSVGIPIMQYTRQRRMRYANALIRSGMTASEAATQLGFTDYSSFYRQYLKVIGHSPYDDRFPKG